ncbi:MAG: PfkB family carbohydrate kinase [Verrucomicrobiota bacterium]|nr:PfkB family carbohydrate kinase [Verrucomicrobiota bacterium]
MATTLPLYAGADPVVIIGSVAYDTIETPYAHGERILGGSASYAALAASYYAPVRIVGVVGNDFAAKDEERLRARGIDLDGLQHDASGPTFYWVGKYHENFNRRDTLELHLNVFERFRPELPSNYRSTPFVLLGNIHPDLQAHVLDQLVAKDVFVLADTIDFWIKTSGESLHKLIRRVDLFVINDSESELLTGEKNVFLAGRKLLADGPKSLIIKKGEHGALLFHQDGIFALPAFPVTELRDPTGAGDSFAGALLGYLASQHRSDFATLKKAMLYATVTASLTVEAFSCDRLESAGPVEIQRRHDELHRMISL